MIQSVGVCHRLLANRVDTFSMLFAPSVEFCFTSQMLKILDVFFYNVAQ